MSVDPQIRRRRILMVGFILAGSVSWLVAARIGIGGHLPGIALTYLTAISFVLAFVHPWKKPRPFLLLMGIAIPAFIVSVLLHHVFEVKATRFGH